MFILRPLPYGLDALEPYISARTMEFHYKKHHQAYIDTLNKLAEGTPFEKMPLEDVISQTIGKPEYTAIFNNAAQAWNHAFFWSSMHPAGEKADNEELADRMIRDFGSIEKFKEEFKAAALAQFGSGWVWLVEDEHSILKIIKTANADTPFAHGLTPLLTCDVWEHAYYLDYQNRRGDFVEAFLNHLANF